MRAATVVEVVEVGCGPAGFCGGHTHAISRYGLTDLLRPNVRMVHGPGCPVCVLPIGRIDMAIGLAQGQGVILCTYGDTCVCPLPAGCR